MHATLLRTTARAVRSAPSPSSTSWIHLATGASQRTTKSAAAATPTCLRTVRHNSSDSKQPKQQQQSSPSSPDAEGVPRQRHIPTAGATVDAPSAVSGFMNMFNDKETRSVSISSCSKNGFVTTEAITLQGPVLCIGGQVFMWDAYKGQEIPSPSARSIFETMDEKRAREVFSVFEFLNPRPELLVVGTGRSFAPLSAAVRSVIRGYGMQVDMMNTANAAATYNVLAEEGREVAAALLPLEPAPPKFMNRAK